MEAGLLDELLRLLGLVLTAQNRVDAARSLGGFPARANRRRASAGAASGFPVPAARFFLSSSFSLCFVLRVQQAIDTLSALNRLHAFDGFLHSPMRRRFTARELDLDLSARPRCAHASLPSAPLVYFFLSW